MKKRWFALAACALSVCVAGCQMTPKDMAVMPKDAERLAQQLQETAAPQETDTASPERWVLDKGYETGAWLHIDAVPNTHGALAVPVARLERHPFTEADVEIIREALVPGADMRKYAICKKEYEKSLNELREFRRLLETDPEEAERLRGSEPAALPTGMDWDDFSSLPFAEQLELSEETFMRMMDEAPTPEELEKEDWEFRGDDQNGAQINACGTVDDRWVTLSIVNWNPEENPGAFFQLNADRSYADTYLWEDIPVEDAEKSPEYEAALSASEDTVQKMGLSYMEPFSVSLARDSAGEHEYIFRFTRVVNGYPEIVPDSHLGTMSLGVDGAEVRPYWKPETLDVAVRGSDVVKITWENPADLEIENENTGVISFDDAKQIALRQMDRILSSSDETASSGRSSLCDADSEVFINRIDLGLAKLAMDDEDEYKLVPVWVFSGYGTNWFMSPHTQSLDGAGAVTAFVVVNAADGTLIDPGLMY